MVQNNLKAKIVILNFSGNVGKTTIASHLLVPRMEKNIPLFSIETINSGISDNGVEAEKIKGKKFRELTDNLMMLDSAIVDVGSSNVEDFMEHMRRYEGSHEEFDYFLVPVIKEQKVQIDTINTIRALNQVGVGKNRIFVVFNKLEIDETIDNEFPAISMIEKKEKMFTLRTEAIIYENEVYEQLKSVGKSLGKLNEDTVDYRQKLRESTDEDEKYHCIQMVALKRLAITANRNLDNVYQALFN